MQTTFINSHNNNTKPLILKNATFIPTIPPKALIYQTTLNTSCKAFRTKKGFFGRLGTYSWEKSKYFLSVIAVMALVMPAKSLTSSQEPSSLEQILISKTLKVATTDEALFTNDTHRHGFGYDIANRYAHHLGAKLDIISFNSEKDALNALKTGAVDVLISDELYDDLSTATLSTSVHCENDAKGLPTHLSVNAHSQALFDNAKAYFCSDDGIADTKAMTRFYHKEVLDRYSLNHFNLTIKQKLPQYKSTFKKVAKKYNHDWEVLAVISYQESHLNPDAVSRTGVQGLMMLTQETAKAMGVADRTNASQSIYGGAKYLDKLNSQFQDIPESDRLWFVLSAYNMGPNAVKNIQTQIAKQGGNPKLWSDFYRYLAENSHKNGRFVQCMHYVTNIRTYLETLKA